MPSKKQRSKEERYRRHGVERPESPQRQERLAGMEAEEESGAAKGKAKGKPKAKSKSRSAAQRARKPVPYPTVRRALIRAPIFGALWYVLITFVLGGNTSPTANLFQAAILTLIMLPLLFGTDTMTYRMAKKRGLETQERPADGFLGFRR